MAAYTPYDFFRVLIDRVGWRNEEEKLAATSTVDEWERMGIFGNLVNMVACQHENIDYRRRPPVCTDCKRTVNL